MSRTRTGRRWPLVVAAVLGIGLALAPVAFQMFTRAPGGGRMLTGFKPYMDTATIEGFRRDLAVIDAAHAQAQPLAGSRYPSVQSFDRQWPGIDADMSSMLTTMQGDITNYRGVAALPPFALFPWFFVIPGVLVAGVALSLLRARRRRLPAVRRHVALAVLGLGLVAAPLVFQMFGRAPGGARMIDDFRPFMTQAKVTQIQGYFLTIGAAEGQLRLEVLPAAPKDVPVDAIRDLNRQWPTIASTMAPMIGAMADNVANYQGIAAMPPFTLFPWFFVIPGVLVVGLAAAARAGRPADQHDLAASPERQGVPS